MRVVVVLFLLIGAALAQKASKYDNVNVDAILENDRILTNYIKCMLDQGRCTPEGRDLKRVLPDSLKNGCAKCEEKHRLMAEKVMNHLRTKRPADWDKLVAKYDPKGEYKKRFEAMENKKH